MRLEEVEDGDGETEDEDEYGSIFSQIKLDVKKIQVEEGSGVSARVFGSSGCETLLVCIVGQFRLLVL